MELRPISLLVRLIVWVVRGTPLMLQLIILFYIPGALSGGKIRLFRVDRPWYNGCHDGAA